MNFKVALISKMVSPIELIAEDLYGNRESLRAALAAIPPLPLEFFFLYRYRDDCIENFIIKSVPSKIRFILGLILRYEGSSTFQIYMIDTGFTFTHQTQRDYLTPPINQAILNWFYAIQFQKIRRVAKARMAILKEELMAAAWHPKRVERLLEAGGFEAIDC